MIGILALQGDVAEHRQSLEEYGAATREIRDASDLEGIRGLVLPGGESTAMRRLIASAGLQDPVMQLIRQGLVVWGTCAGVVLLAEGGPWHCCDVRVERNAYGPQLYSRVARGASALAEGILPLVFIRAPRMLTVPAEALVLCEWEGDIVALRHRNILLTTFHPELCKANPFTGYFLNMVDAATP